MQINRPVALLSAISLIIAGCATPATQARLDAANAACAAGDQNACYAAQQAAYQAQGEAETNAAITVGVLSLVGTAALLAGGPHGGPGRPHGPPPRFH